MCFASSTPPAEHRNLLALSSDFSMSAFQLFGMVPLSFGPPFDVGCSMLDVRCSMFDVGCSMLDVRCWMFDVGCSMFDVGCSMLDVRCWMFDVGCSMLDVRCWMFDVGCWMLDVGCWMFDVGCSMLDVRCWMFGPNLPNPQPPSVLTQCGEKHDGTTPF
jgi:hypothetical protein